MKSNDAFIISQEMLQCIDAGAFVVLLRKYCRVKF